MGAWGPGLQANDTAKGAILVIEEKLSKAGQPLHAFVAEHGVHKLIKKASKYGVQRYTNVAVLGAAEWLTDRNVDVSKDPLVLEALKAEKYEERIHCYAEPEERVRVLELFGKRLFEGLTPEEEKEAGEFNKGIFTRLLKAVDVNNPPSE